MSAILKQKLIDIANGFTKYGLWKGGGSGGSSALSEMTDVTFTNLQRNDVLKYNGIVWVNDDDLHEYSTEEKIVGKWIDGKPIYEKTFTGLSFSLNYVGWRPIINISNNNNIICGFGLDNYNQLFYPTALGHVNEEVDWYQSNSLGNIISTITVQYTKTTD